MSGRSTPCPHCVTYPLKAHVRECINSSTLWPQPEPSLVTQWLEGDLGLNCHSATFGVNICVYCIMPNLPQFLLLTIFLRLWMTKWERKHLLGCFSPLGLLLSVTTQGITKSTSQFDHLFFLHINLKTVNTLNVSMLSFEMNISQMLSWGSPH